MQMTDVITKKTTGEIKNREAALRWQRDLQSRVWRSPPARQGSGLEARDFSRHRRVLPAQFSRGGAGGKSIMRLQMHATDPDFRETPGRAGLKWMHTYF